MVVFLHQKTVSTEKYIVCETYQYQVDALPRTLPPGHCMVFADIYPTPTTNLKTLILHCLGYVPEATGSSSPHIKFILQSIQKATNFCENFGGFNQVVLLPSMCIVVHHALKLSSIKVTLSSGITWLFRW